jgi:hypothetical protein
MLDKGYHAIFESENFLYRYGEIKHKFTGKKRNMACGKYSTAKISFGGFTPIGIKTFCKNIIVLAMDNYASTDFGSSNNSLGQASTPRL